jgi:hypothetical protein
MKRQVNGAAKLAGVSPDLLTTRARRARERLRDRQPLFGVSADRRYVQVRPAACAA